MRALRNAGKVAVVIGAAAMSGCYTYVPVQHPAPGSTVRIEVPVRSSVAGRTTEESAAMEGIVLSAGDTLVMEMSTRRELGAYRELTAIDTIRLATADLNGMATRNFSKPKTLGLTAVIAGGVTVLAVAALGLGGGSGGGSGPGGGTTTGSVRVIPIFSSLLHALGR